jgi:hypothetical protein
MLRLRLLFAIILLILALPFWRYTDMIAIASPFEWPLTLAMFIWSGIFIAIPLKLIYQKLKVWMLLLVMVGFGLLSFWSTPLSRMSTTNPDFNHCGYITFTGSFYPIAPFVTDAYRDDLEARNQMCWIRKMISRVPEKYELGPYIKIVHDKLLKPQIKYRASLPLIAVLMVKINFGTNESNAPLNVYDSLHFWIDHYTEEISERKYSAWNWPHSNYIKFEYGLIEKNWQSVIDSIVISK